MLYGAFSDDTIYLGETGSYIRDVHFVNALPLLRHISVIYGIFLQADPTRVPRYIRYLKEGASSLE